MDHSLKVNRICGIIRIDYINTLTSLHFNAFLTSLTFKAKQKKSLHLYKSDFCTSLILAEGKNDEGIQPQFFISPTVNTNTGTEAVT